MGSRIKIQIALPFLLIAISLFIGKMVIFKPALTDGEMRMLGFVSEKIDIPERKTFVSYRNLKSPVEIAAYPSVPLSSLVPQVKNEISGINVSLIIISKESRLAIVNGLIVKEGDGIGNMQIAKIEKSRILIKEIRKPFSIGNQIKETRWIYLEENK
ncbi:MAG: hypothetical protein AB1610_06795 [Nitrospirota bacterium]